MDKAPNKRIFYVDESGDLNFFTKKGVMYEFDLETCPASRYFTIGFIKIDNSVEEINSAILELKANIINDKILANYFKPKNDNLFYFHAKDDHILIRREVFNVISKLNFTFQCIVRRKSEIKKRYDRNKIPKHKKQIVNEKAIYHDSIAYLFKRNLHIDENKIVLSKRGSTFNDISIKEAINKSQKSFLKQFRLEDKNTNIYVSNPHFHTGLQLVDYLLWAVNRYYCSNETHWYEFIKEKVSLIIDYDHPDGNEKYGIFFNRKNEITKEKIARGS